MLKDADCVMYIVDNSGFCTYFVDGIPVKNPVVIEFLDKKDSTAWVKNFVCNGEIHYCGVLIR